MNYSEKLMHPNWQRRRLEIMQRDEFTCQLCGDKETTLNVHHKLYKRGDIWEYDDSELITYCKVCHSIVEFCKREFVGQTIIDIKKKDGTSENGRTYSVAIVESEEVLLVEIYSFDIETNEVRHIISLREETLKDIVLLFERNLKN